jgi:hypothetical protein
VLSTGAAASLGFVLAPVGFLLACPVVRYLVSVGRIAAPEFEDFDWFPATLRDPMTGVIRVAMEVFRVPAVVAPLISEAMATGQTERVVDLCSGGGGAILGVIKRLRQEGKQNVSVTLTDMYPNLGAFARAEKELPGAVSYRTQPTDASAVPSDLAGVRTIFNALHHLPPEVARAVFADAVDKRQPILTFEVLQRTPIDIIGAVTGFINTLILMPFVKPRRLSNFVFTYLIPLVPLFLMWDGVASCLRQYSADELESLVAPLRSRSYTFRIERHKVPWMPMTVTCVVGLPVP